MSSALRLLAAALALCMCLPAVAGSHKPAFGGDFTFRKIAPPKSGTRKLINIQIEPEAKPATRTAAAAAAATAKPAAPKGDSHDWFWQVVSADIAGAGPGRFLDAVEQLDRAPTGKAVKGPSLSSLQKIADSHGAEILLQTLDKQISPALVLALISVESGGRVAAESNKGAQGLMQLIPETAERFGVADATDAKQNIKGGVAYLDWLIRHFDGDPILALAGYNAGEGAVRSHQGVPPYAETRAYVPKVLAAWKVARSMCMTPPLLASDGCVFRVSG